MCLIQNKNTSLFIKIVLSIVAYICLFFGNTLKIAAYEDNIHADNFSYFYLATQEDAEIFQLYLNDDGDKGRNLAIVGTDSYLFAYYAEDNSFHYCSEIVSTLKETEKERLLYILYTIMNDRSAQAYNLTTESRQIIFNEMFEQTPELEAMWLQIVLNHQSADIATGVTGLSGVLPYIRIFLGVLILIFFLGIMLSTSLDLFVLLVPTIQDFFSTKCRNKRGQILFISKTCRGLMQETEQVGGMPWRTTVLTYFTRRLSEILLALAIIVILLLGSLGTTILEITHSL